MAKKLQASWDSIQLAQTDCENKVAELHKLMSVIGPPANTSVVAFGSLARGEYTSGSDVDWTLLIDGPSSMHHFETAIEITEALAANEHKKPGRTGTFGNMCSSHQLVHFIGGTEDTNHNLTRRILLLLESTSLSDEVTHERVIRSILERYIVGDPPSTNSSIFRVPLFLFNDVVRFWRTMTVDYATKKWERSNEGWALRNIKLRMSRKLLFVKGILTCFLCDKELVGKNVDQESTTAPYELLEYCFGLARTPAIELLAKVLDEHATKATAVTVMEAYDNFLSMLHDHDQRDHLEKLEFGRSDDEMFEKARKNSHQFRDGLQTLFFDSNERLTHLIKRYGVF